MSGHVQRFGGIQGTVDIAPGIQSGHVNFTQDRGFPPISVRLTLQTDEENIFATVMLDSVTRYGFDFELSALPTVAARLSYLCEIS